MALTDQLPTITAYAKDVGYDVIFVEQLKNFAEPGDLFMAMRGSGNSPNVVRRSNTWGASKTKRPSIQNTRCKKASAPCATP